MPESSLDIKQGALFVTSSAAWRWNKILLAELKEGNPLAAIVVATEQRSSMEVWVLPTHCRQRDR